MAQSAPRERARPGLAGQAYRCRLASQACGGSGLQGLKLAGALASHDYRLSI